MRLRNLARSFAVIPEISRPSSIYSPDVGRSRHPRIFIRVLLPEPLVPINATRSPRVNLKGDTSENRNIDLAEMVSLVDIVKFNQPHRWHNPWQVSVATPVNSPRARKDSSPHPRLD